MHKNDSTATLSGVWAHETTGSSMGNGHQAQLALAATLEPTCARIPAILERVVGGDSLLADNQVRIVREEGLKSLWWAGGSHYLVHSVFAFAPSYEVVPQVTLADTLDALFASDKPGVPLVPDMDPYQPNPAYNCTRVY